MIADEADEILGTNALPARARSGSSGRGAARGRPTSCVRGRSRSSRRRPTAGSVFVVRDGERLIAATTRPEPTVGLVFYDLKSCLRSIDAPSRADASDDAAA